MRLRISSALLDEIERAARAAAPREACGLLIGTQSDTETRVESLAPSVNLAQGDDAFEIDPALLLRLQKSLRGTPQQMVGVYHSHPKGKAEPSPRDVAGAFYPGFVWLISALESNAPRHGAFWHKAEAGVPPQALELIPIILA